MTVEYHGPRVVDDVPAWLLQAIARRDRQPAIAEARPTHAASSQSAAASQASAPARMHKLYSGEPPPVANTQGLPELRRARAIHQRRQWREGAIEAHVPRAVPGGEPLFVDVVPRTAWFSNLRSVLPARDWDTLRKRTYSKAGNVCQACGGRGPRHPVEAHERWVFNAANRVQRLDRIVALCPACHAATHFGLARIRGFEAEAIHHLCQVNSWSEEQAWSEVHHRMNLAKLQSRIADWRLDMRMLLREEGLSDAVRPIVEGYFAGRIKREVTKEQAEIITDEEDSWTDV